MYGYLYKCGVLSINNTIEENASILRRIADEEDTRCYNANEKTYVLWDEIQKGGSRAHLRRLYKKYWRFRKEADEAYEIAGMYIRYYYDFCRDYGADVL